MERYAHPVGGNFEAAFEILRRQVAATLPAKPPAGKWRELRAYWRARQELADVETAHPSHWYACAYGKETATHFARLEYHRRRDEVEQWAQTVRQHAFEWAREDEPSIVEWWL